MKRILILVAISLFLCSTASAFQGGGGESTKKGSNKKKEVTKKKNSRTKSDNTTPPKPPAPPAPRPTATGMGALPLRGYEFDVVTVNSNGSEMSRRKGQAQYCTEEIAGISLELVAIPGGTFVMGSTEDDSEKPSHQVTVGSFNMGKYEVTQAQWRAVARLPKISRDLDSDPSKFKGDNLPVQRVSWEDAMEFCARLSRATGRSYRLPTEAEWEYACRAGTTTPFAFGQTITPQLVNYNGAYPYAQAPKGTYRETTTPVGFMGVANGFGLFDMHGNVIEWCLDYWHENYNGAPSDGRSWETAGDTRYRVLRGGSWYRHASHCRSADRSRLTPDSRAENLGFRVVVAVRGTTIPTTAAPPSVSAQPVETKIRAGDARAPSLTVDLGNGVKMEFVPVQAGSFQMGSDKNDDEKPPHRVTISQPFYLGKYEVTQEQWQAVMNNNPSEFKDCGGNCPVEQVSWDDAQEFIKRLNARLDGHTYRLPTEAEWEYAARADTTGDFAGNLDEDKMGWFLENSRAKTHPVGQKKPNAWGLYDMHGNVFEWVQDWYDENYYKNSPSTDPQGPNSSQDRVLRGGSWYSYGPFYHPGQRYNKAAGERVNDIGFRVVVIVRT
jgi:formylglycine-generating enzyme required for sulfatase activity